ncbi:MAG: succinyl-diaminopimelate desuccinylase [Patescibacteria group bacterium]|nr:MAG: succinyl-diaminopimelate desuccinylase [Patescibacteria group bacterium]
MQELTNILVDLIKLRSDVDTANDESSVTKYIANFFKDLSSWKVIEQKVTKQRSNLIVTNSEDPQIVFVGHQDTVPVTSEEQLTSVVKDGRLYGRGAVDMKSGLAMMLLLAKQGVKKDVAFIFTVDEEYEFLGAKKFIEKNKWKPKILINPEPSDLKILTQCRGFTELYLEFEGVSVHAGRKKLGINAIEHSIKFTSLLESELQKYDNGKMKTSVNLAALNGGISVNGQVKVRPNVVPDFAQVVIEIRIGAAELTKSKIKEIVESVAKKVKLKLSSFRNELWFGPMLEKNEGLKEFVDAFKKNRLPVSFLNPNKAGFYEVQMLQSVWNCPVVIFGPGPNKKSHQKDEYVDLSSLEKAFSVLSEYLKTQ